MMRAGVLILLFVAYQLWGTGLATNRAQNRLESEFATQLAQAPTTTTSPSHELHDVHDDAPGDGARRSADTPAG